MLTLTRWTIAHRRIVVISWIVLAVGVLALSQAVGKRNANNFSLPNTDSQRAVDLLQSRFPAQAGDADQIVFRTRDRQARRRVGARRDRAGARTHRRATARRRRGEPL